MLVAWTEEESRRPAGSGRQGRTQRLPRVRRSSAADEVYRRVPDLGPGALAGLTVPGESIICTWTTNLALATDAVARGARLLRGARVTGVEVGPEHTTLHTTAGDVHGRWIINAAGLGADHLDAEFGYDRFTVTPRRGELLVFDKLTRPMVPLHRARRAVVTRQGRPGQPDHLRQRDGRPDVGEPAKTAPPPAPPRRASSSWCRKGRALMPSLFDEEVTASLRRSAGRDRPRRLPHRRRRRDQRYVLVGGIRSTGLTSGMAVAEHVAGAAGRRRAWTSPNVTACRRHRGCRTSVRPASRPYQDARAHRRRPRVRPHRVLLRTGQRRRDPRRVRLPHPACAISTGCAAAPA